MILPLGSGRQLQAEKKGFGKLFKRHDRRDGITGDPNDRFSVNNAKDGRLSGHHGNPMHKDIPQIGYYAGVVIPGTCWGAGIDDNQIRIRIPPLLKAQHVYRLLHHGLYQKQEVPPVTHEQDRTALWNWIQWFDFFNWPGSVISPGRISSGAGRDDDHSGFFWPLF